MDNIFEMSCACEGFLDKFSKTHLGKAMIAKGERQQAELREKARNAGERPTFVDMNKTKAIADKYHIHVDQVPKGRIADSDALVRDVFASLKSWVAAMKRSDAVKEAAEKALAEYDRNPEEGTLWMAGYDNGKRPTLSMITSGIKVSDGVNGNEESASIIDDDQSICILFGFIPEDLTYLLSYRYAFYLKNITFGDGDEGHVYYDIRSDAFEKPASEAFGFGSNYDFNQFRKTAEESAKMFGIKLPEPIPAGELGTKEAVIASVQDDAKAWLDKIVKSRYMATMIHDEIAKFEAAEKYKARLAKMTGDAAEEEGLKFSDLEDEGAFGFLYNTYDKKPTPRELLRHLVICDDPYCGRECGIQVVKADDLGGWQSQNIAIMFSPIVKDLENLIAYKYANYFSFVNMGDSDNGTISFTFR